MLCVSLKSSPPANTAWLRMNGRADGAPRTATASEKAVDHERATGQAVDRRAAGCPRRHQRRDHAAARLSSQSDGYHESTGGQKRDSHSVAAARFPDAVLDRSGF